MGWHLLSLLAVSLASPATALIGQDVPATAAVQDKPEDAIVVKGEKDPKKKMVCRSSVATGSIMLKRTCMTQESWEARQAKDQETAQALKEEQARRQATKQAICMARGMLC
ncbi:hypothetical protein P6144_01745 [Sphingomonas sp. HITSZ_GF]|uniref:hypothetical protein n=1 Tax=Sphingomonas sp. HITSZ_GF TaxID=3037247 RepID=UPI00240E582E|nr:hypothetical protein [Sphingomonas sp. HITSZ_GF]MDG2532356.1 hypothetical protein [Sphingomonas sp. HITSZ_GF]